MLIRHLPSRSCWLAAALLTALLGCDSGTPTEDGTCEPQDTCTESCPSGLTECGEACRDVAWDPTNCGACDNVCATGQACVHGVCAPPCSADSDCTALSVVSTFGNESAGQLDVVVTRTGSTAGITHVGYNVTPGTALLVHDFTANDGVATFAAGETQLVISIDIVDDDLFESDETLTLSLGPTTLPANETVRLLNTTATVTIVDDDTAPDLSIDDVVVRESNGVATVVFSLAAPSALPTTIHYQTSDGTGGVAGSDYVARTGVATIAAGDTEVALDIEIVDDGIPEDGGSFGLAATAFSGATAVDTDATISIVDDDSVISAASATAAENAGTLSFTINRIGSAGTSQAHWQVTSGTATAGEDFVATGGLVVFAPGDTSKNVVITLINDALLENSETLTLLLDTPINSAGGTAHLEHSSITGTISNDDSVPGLSVNDVFVPEGAGSLQFRVQLSAVSALPTSFDFTTGASTATASDFVANSGSATIPAGATSTYLSVTLVNDVALEADENFSLTLSNPVGASLVDGTGVATIIEDDATFSLTASVTLSENSTPGSVSVTRVGSFSFGGSVDYRTEITGSGTGHATPGVDYGSVSGTLVFAPGETTRVISIPMIDDAVVETGGETFVLILGNPQNGTAGDAFVTVGQATIRTAD